MIQLETTTLPLLATSSLDEGISLRLLALILCSNCSNTFNKVLTTIGGHMLNYFLELEVSLGLAQYSSRMVEAFHSRHDLCTPKPPPPYPNTYTHLCDIFSGPLTQTSIPMDK